MPSNKNVKVCVSVNDFEYENCRVLDVDSGFASNPKGLSVTGVSSDISTCCSSGGADCPVVISGTVQDEFGYYSGVYGLRVYDSSSELLGSSDHDTVGSFTIEGLSVSQLGSGSSETYYVTTYIGPYYETSKTADASFTITCP
jgi:hypothetical protein